MDVYGGIRMLYQMKLGKSRIPDIDNRLPKSKNFISSVCSTASEVDDNHEKRRLWPFSSSFDMYHV